MKFLIVDDDKAIVEAVTIGLQFQWQDAEVHSAQDGEQVVINLLSNVHKYSPAGSRVEVRALLAGNECRVTVRDDGPGVPPEERELIFGRFYRSSLHRQDRTASTGLGLPIVRKVAEMHRGRVWVEPAPGGGSLFTLALPRAA